jgi:selenocysteine lyase/cysteine desulfurase
MCVAPLPANGGLSAQELQRRLWEEHQVEIPIVEWHGYRFARLSIQAYNSVADVERLLDGLQQLRSSASAQESFDLSSYEVGQIDLDPDRPSI